MGHRIDIDITHFFVNENRHFLFSDFFVKKNIFAFLYDVVKDLIGDWDWLHILIYYVFVKYIFILQLIISDGTLFYLNLLSVFIATFCDILGFSF